MQVALAYTQPTSVVTSLTGSALDFATNLRRPPVAFRGRVKEPVLLRQLLIALHEVVLTDYSEASDRWFWLLDPVITVHHDELFFEAFSNDESSYARLSAPMAAFEPEDEPSYGTTNIDFTWALRDALQRMRSSRRTEFTVGAAGFGVTTAGPSAQAHWERKVDLPESWVKGFLQVQGALAMRPFLFDVRPVDLLTAIAFWSDNKPPRPPHGLRYELAPGEPIRLAVEPWDERFTLKGTRYDGYPRSVRVWGRKRLELLRGVLPYAERVTVGLLGRGLPHIYICHCGVYRFTLVLSGWTKNDWAKGSAFDELAPRTAIDSERVANVYANLHQRLAAPVAGIAAETALAAAEVQQALFELCRGGRAMIDPVSGLYRLRALFAEPIDVGTLFAPDGRQEIAEQLLQHGRVRLRSVVPPEQRDDGRRETRVVAEVDDEQVYEVTVSVDLDGRLRFGRCGCAFFQNNLLSRGPCEHILAARLLLDQPTAGEAAVLQMDEDRFR